jgi:hypothetical protein
VDFLRLGRGNVTVVRGRGRSFGVLDDGDNETSLMKKLHSIIIIIIIIIISR